ncbi:PAAR domain-containing protein [Burkholderia sp. BCC0322]|uniref:PAAR domain-containing protein n=1 Tax=unclassified Burkholderia TaxID=2613784 RepID=UPI00158875F7|nr:PAAR domain-containing protein [Burkholderia sp. BCC0322]
MTASSQSGERNVRTYRPAVRDGDRTTTRGRVVAHSSTIFDHGKHVALNGDRATCGNCEGSFSIFGTGKGLFGNGRDAVVDGDLVMCPCGSNRVMAGQDSSIFLAHGLGSSHLSTASQAVSSTGEVYDEQFQLIDQITGRPLANVRYRITSDTNPHSTIQGTTDDAGLTRRVITFGYGKLHLDIQTG